jgi:hypothetical protein
MKNTTFKRVLALATVFTMVFAAVMVFNTTPVQAAPTGNVSRVELTATWGNFQTNAVNWVAGNQYTASFWLMNTEGSSELYLQGGGDPWPAIASEIPSQSGAWVQHVIPFTAPAGQTALMIYGALEGGTREVGTVFYLSAITITAANGTSQTFAPGEHAQWTGADITIVAPPEGPSFPVAAGGGGGSARVNPLTGDNSFNPLWLVASGVGLLASLAALFVVFKKKK